MLKSTFWSDRGRGLDDHEYRAEFSRQTQRITAASRTRNTDTGQVGSTPSAITHDEDCPFCALSSLAKDPSVPPRERKRRRREVAAFIDSLSEE